MRKEPPEQSLPAWPAWPGLFIASARLEAQLLVRSKAFLVLTLMQALAFLALASLFGLTGSMAPAALIDNDHGPLAAALIQDLANAHHSFRLMPMSRSEADSRLSQGRLVAAITIPDGFSAAVTRGQTVPVQVAVDNVNADLPDDVERAFPSAIVTFGRNQGFPGVRVVVAEHDLIRADTGYIEYLAVSVLALDALILGAILGGTAVAGEFERGTLRIWRQSPARSWPLLAGKLASAAAVGVVAMAATTLVVVLGYGIRPLHPWTAAGAVVTSEVIFTGLGAWLGAVVKRTLPLVPLVFGLAIPLYVDSGSLEPARFDGEAIWWIAHASPVYYAIGVLQSAFHGLQVTPEGAGADLAILLAGASIAVAAAMSALHRAPAR